MKIYIAHSRSYNYEEELYQPIRQSELLRNFEIILPHEISQESNNSRDFYSNLDLIIAEVSYPTTGLGIELGWAFDSNVPIVCISRSGVKVSGSLHTVTDQFYEYENEADLISIITKIIQNHQK